jgi:succinyl-CoA synthetase alpha subunit
MAGFSIAPMPTAMAAAASPWALVPDSKVLVHGILEAQVPTRTMVAAGTTIVAGIAPGKGGGQLDQIPLYDLVEQAIEQQGPIDVALIFVPAYRVLDAALESIAAGIPKLILINDGVPPLDVVQMLRRAGSTLILGPGSPGIIRPGKLLLGLHPPQFYQPGPIAVFGRGMALTCATAQVLSTAGLGQSICVGLGSDGLVGSSFTGWLADCGTDPTTEAIVLVGEPGGEEEEQAAAYLLDHPSSKPVIAYIAGASLTEANLTEASTPWIDTLRLGPYKTVVGDRTTYGLQVNLVQAKVQALAAAGVTIAPSLQAIPELLRQALGQDSPPIASKPPSRRRRSRSV